MIAERNTATSEERGREALSGRGCDWSTLVHLARRVLEAASLAVLAHAELESEGKAEQARPQIAGRVGKDA